MSSSIPIVMVTDNNYIIQTKVAIWSLVKNIKKGSNIEIFILCSNYLEQKHKDDLLELKKYLNNFELNFLEVDSYIFRNAKNFAHVSVASFYRLIIADLLNVDKCLYLDVDIIVRGDVSTLFTIDIGDNYIAGVKDPVITEDFENVKKILELPNLEEYINAGVLIFNLKKIREEKIVETFLYHMDLGYPFMDQDVLNKVCWGKIKYLDLKYNLLSSTLANKDGFINPSLEMKEIEDAKDSFIILHYSGGTEKPWNNIRVSRADLWWECAKQIIDAVSYENMLKKVQNERKLYRNAWKEIVKRCCIEKKIIVFGFSRITRNLVDLLEDSEIKNIVCFCDNDFNKQGKIYNGLCVYEPKEAVLKYSEVLWIVASQKYSKEITEQLREIGIRKEKIIYYREHY